MAITNAPSYHPTPRRRAWILKGTIFYDRNANGERDSGVDSPQFGKDVEYEYGLGGVTVQLMECDPETNRGFGKREEAAKYEEGDNSYASAVSSGFDVLMHPKLAGKKENGGRYNLVNIKIGRAYYIYVKAPHGYLFSGGVCNDKVRGWECQYSDAEKFAKGYNRVYNRGGSARMLWAGERRSGASLLPARWRSLDAAPSLTQVHKQKPGSRLPELAAEEETLSPPNENELELGISEGRSERCIAVDRYGRPEGHLDVGVMRVGDVSFDDTKVDLNLNLADESSLPGVDDLPRRVLWRRIRNRVLREGPAVEGIRQEDKDAIGAVTSEIIAISLDKQLKKLGAVLDSVAPLDVSYIAPEPVIAELSINGTDGNDALKDNMLAEDAADDAVASGFETSSSGSLVEDGEISTVSKNGVSNSNPAHASNANDTTPARGLDAPVPENAQIAGTQRRRAGKITVSLLVRGHYGRGLGVDFDRLVQDSINREAPAIRQQLAHYNTNCREQTTKVIEEGFALEDFAEVHTNKGVKRQMNKRQQQGLNVGNETKDAANTKSNRQVDDSQAYSSACEMEKVLPEYFEESLGGMELIAKGEDRSSVAKEDREASLWAIIGVVMGVGILCLCFGCCLFHRGAKRKKKQNQEAKVTHILQPSGGISEEDSELSSDEKILKWKEMRKTYVRTSVDASDDSGAWIRLDSSESSYSTLTYSDRSQQCGGLRGAMRRGAALRNAERGRRPSRRISRRVATTDLDERMQNNSANSDDDRGGVELDAGAEQGGQRRGSMREEGADYSERRSPLATVWSPKDDRRLEEKRRSFDSHYSFKDTRPAPPSPSLSGKNASSKSSRSSQSSLKDARPVLERSRMDAKPLLRHSSGGFEDMRPAPPITGLTGKKASSKSSLSSQSSHKYAKHVLERSHRKAKPLARRSSGGIKDTRPAPPSACLRGKNASSKSSLSSQSSPKDTRPVLEGSRRDAKHMRPTSPSPGLSGKSASSRFPSNRSLPKEARPLERRAPSCRDASLTHSSSAGAFKKSGLSLRISDFEISNQSVRNDVMPSMDRGKCSRRRSSLAFSSSGEGPTKSLRISDIDFMESKFGDSDSHASDFTESSPARSTRNRLGEVGTFKRQKIVHGRKSSVNNNIMMDNRRKSHKFNRRGSNCSSNKEDSGETQLVRNMRRSEGSSDKEGNSNTPLFSNSRTSGYSSKTQLDSNLRKSEFSGRSRASSGVTPPVSNLTRGGSVGSSPKEEATRLSNILEDSSAHSSSRGRHIRRFSERDLSDVGYGRHIS